MTVKTPAQLTTELNALWPDNTSGLITPTAARTTLQDFIDSLSVIPVPSAGVGVNINSLSSAPFVTDGVTSNLNQFLSLWPVLQSVGTEFPVPVNFTVGNPTVISLNPTVASGGTLPNPVVHNLKPNQAFYFILTSGSIAGLTGISLNTPYYIKSIGLTATTFTFSSVNNYGPNFTVTSEGPANITSGSLAGATLSIVLTGRDVNLLIPPGPYFGGNYAGPGANMAVTPNGMTRLRYWAYGAMFDTKISLGASSYANSFVDAATGFPGVFDYINTTPNELVVPGLDAIVTLLTTTQTYWPGQWLSVMGLNIQDPYGQLISGPPNYQYQEYKRIKTVSGSTLTLDGPLKWVYLSTFPNIFTPPAFQVGGGKAMIIPMHPSWDCSIEVLGARWIGEPTVQYARNFTMKDCVWSGFGNAPGQVAPSVSQNFIFRNCTFAPNSTSGSAFMEVDKMIEYLEIDSCKADDKYAILFPSTSLHICVMKNHRGGTIIGTPRNISIRDSYANFISIGPQNGVTDSAEISDSKFTSFNLINRPDDNNFINPSNDMTLVPNWTFSNGTFTRNISALPGQQAQSWMIPGAKVYMTDASNTFKFFQNIGAPFAILNVYMDGSGNFSFDTTLTAVPTRQTSATVTINIGTGVFTGAALANGTPVCLTTTGALPTGVTNSTIYWVVNTSGATFQLSLTVGGAAIALSGSQSGVHTAYANPLCFRPHPCPCFTGIGNTGCSTIIDQNGAIDEPLFSRVNRSFVGKQNVTNPSAFQSPLPNIWGFLKSLNINVRKAGTASGTLTVSCPGFTQPNLALSNFSQVIDTTVAGLRSWTGSAAPTGSAGGDTIAAYADWVAGPLLFTWSLGVSLPASPLIELEMRTDQGITKFANMMGAPGTPASGFNTWQYAHSGIIQQYGSTP